MIRTLLAAIALSLASPCLGQEPTEPGPGTRPVPAELQKAGVQRFLFNGWQGPAIPVWYLRPASAGADAPVLFVMHGVGRDADRYIGEWVDLARQHGIVIIVPEFSRAAFPGAAGYNNGALFDAEGHPKPRAVWSYSALEPIFDAVVAREALKAGGYALYGHSAGAQFVHRHVQTGGGPRLTRAIAANAGSYMFPTEDVAWPFGAGGLPPGAWDASRALAQPLILLLGTADNDPKHRSLPSQPEAQAQGPHRLARGKAFFAFARQQAKAQKIPLGWRCYLAPDVAHDNGRMAPFAIALLLAPNASSPSAECADASDLMPKQR